MQIDAAADHPAPQTPEEVEAIERDWLEHTYKGATLPELTGQVIVISVLLGALMVAFNIYMGLKTGWGEGGSIIAVILGFAIMKALGRKYSILENNATQTFASAAGSLGNIVNVIPALILLADEGVIPHAPTFLDVLLWVFFTSFLGVFFAIPLRRQMVIVDQLTFPTGTAAAQTIQAMHAKGADAMKKARALATMGLGSFVLTWLRDGPGAFLPQAILAPAKLKGLGGLSLASLNIGAAFSPMMFGAGFLVGPRVGISLAIGGFVAWGIIAPILHMHGIDAAMAMTMTSDTVSGQCATILGLDPIPADKLAFVQENCKYMAQVHSGNLYSIIVKWTMWPGLGLMVAAGLTSTLMKGKIMLRAITSLFDRKAGKSPIDHLQFPTWQWAVGLILSGVGVMAMLQLRFEVPWYFGLLSILLSFILAVIAVRATGETDINPVGAMGSVTQIAFGVAQSGGHAALGSVTSANLLTGGVAAGGASEAADMMQDLKTGWLVG
ncbi:MAG: OPT family oligopeptide transporter, partial [Oligoflexia bacterium]|nr:OPT family oligopeptide transporter [Oligoflexia bacterium]